MSKILIHQGTGYYPLHLHFKTPFGNIFNFSEEERDEILRTRVLNEENGHSYITAIYSKIAKSLLFSMPFMGPGYDYYDVIISILQGEMFHEYYTCGPNGEKLMDYINEGYVCKDKHILPSSELVYQADEAWTNFISEYLVEIKGNHLNWKENDANENRPAEYWSSMKTSYKLSHRGLVYAKARDFDNLIIQGLKEVYVRRWSILDFRLLEAIIAYIYFDMELYIYFHPHSFELGICDKEHFSLKSTGAYIIADFGKAINSVFCEDCIDRIRKNSKLNKIKKGENQKIILEALNKACEDFKEIVIKNHYDDFDLTLNGYANDTNRLHELEEKTPYGIVGLVRHGSKRKRIMVTNSKTLKDIRKSLKKK